jgi:hypothetical protein
VLAGVHGPGDGRTSRGFLRNDGREIPRTDLVYIPFLGESFQLAFAQADVQIAIQEADRGRRRSFLADSMFHIVGQLQILRARQSMRQHGGLQRDNRQ